ncbi:hypothetical protein KC19_2G136200 [Ceratodon purpureus]|uniref:Uncharacterized protein n=1 Tax=Ceratodon purpureus TaxID=3225 RepID=A0A8T0IVQ6_CERPU|nr:hypothetical protein KC19_2G136200 [Ceratodon purpureus]
MECRKVQEQAWDEREVHVVVVGSSSSYQSLRFALLASRWLPLPLGILVWSALHLLLLFVETLILLVLVVFLLYNDFMFHFYLIPVLFIFVALWDIVVLIMDTLRCIYVTIRVIASGEATPGTATKVALERIGGIRLFRCVRTVAEYRSNERDGRRWLIPFLITILLIQECWSGRIEPGVAREPVMDPEEPRQPREGFLKLRLKRLCEEIMPHFDVVSF